MAIAHFRMPSLTVESTRMTESGAKAGIAPGEQFRSPQSCATANASPGSRNLPRTSVRSTSTVAESPGNAGAGVPRAAAQIALVIL